MELDKNTQNKIINIAILLLGIILVFLFWNIISNIINPFLYALILAYLFDPIVNFLEENGLKRIQAVIIVFIVIIIIVIGLLMIFIPRLAEEITSFINYLPRLLGQLEEYINNFDSEEMNIIPESFLNLVAPELDLIEVEDGIDDIIERVTDRITEIIRTSLNQVYSILITSTGTILNIFLALFIAFYYLKDKRLFFLAALKRFPIKRRQKIKNLIRDIDRAIGGYIKGQLLVTIFVGLLTGLGSAFIGISYSYTIGLVAGVTNIIPYFGPWIGGILPVAIGLANEPITALYVFIWIIIVQQIESNIIRPVLLSRNVGLHPITIIFSVLFFGNLFGTLGMIIGVPLTAIIKIIVRYFLELKNNYQAQRE